MKIYYTIPLLIVVCLVFSGCKKDVATLEGNWQLTGFSNTTIHVHFDTIHPSDTITYNFYNGVMYAAKNRVQKGAVGLLAQLNLSSNGTATMNEIYTPFGFPKEIAVFNGTWTYTSGAGSVIDFIGLQNSSLYYQLGCSPDTYFNVEQLTDHTLVISHKHVLIDTGNHPCLVYLEEHISSTLTFSKY